MKINLDRHDIGLAIALIGIVIIGSMMVYGMFWHTMPPAAKEPVPCIAVE